MRRRAWYPLVLAAALGLASQTRPPGGQSPAQTLDEVLASHLEAMGGEERLASLSTVRMEGTYREEFMESESPFVLHAQFPDRMRFSLLMGPNRSELPTLVCDGERAWQWVPDTGLVLHPVEGAQLKRILRACDLESSLPTRSLLESRLTLAGREQLGGRETFVLDLVYDNEDRGRVWLDAESFLPVQSSETWTIGDQQVQIVRRFDDYRKVGGLTLPHLLEEENAVGWRRYVTKSVELDPEIEEGTFELDPSLIAGDSP